MNYSKGIILIIVLCASIPARAETPCEVIDKVLGTISIVRDIQGGQDENDYFKSISDLKNKIKFIELSNLIPPDSHETLAKEKKALFFYITNLQMAVAEMDFGYDDHAKSRLNKILNDNFTDTLQSLEYQWNCRVSETSNDARIFISPDEGFRDTAPSALEENLIGEAARPVAEKSNLFKNPSQSGIKKQATLNLGKVLKRDIVLLFSIVLLVLISALFYIKRRHRNYAVRDKRRRLNKTVNVGIAQDYYGMGIVDISLNGAKIQHENLIKDHLKLRIHLGGEWHAAQVKWHNASFAGVKFVRPISQQVFNTVINS